MGLLTSWSSLNRVISQDKTVRYSRRKVYGEWSYLSAVSVITTLDHAYEYHRICTKQYRYVGMDRATAGACAAAMISKYTRSTKESQWNGSGVAAGTFTDESAGVIPMADVAIIHEEGCMYSVQVSVNEDDTKMRVGALTPSSLFADEDGRDYDTED